MGDRSVLIIYTGGTIGMVSQAPGGGLKNMELDRLSDAIPELRQLDVHIESIAVEQPIDSSNMQPSDWQWLARTIHTHANAYDGFVVLHGSDTMAYSASALSFMLNGFDKPVILTGSQLPIGVLRTDAKENLLTAIEVAAAVHPDGLAMVPEVAVYFEYGLYRGNRCTKVSAERFEAFRSPNYPLLAEAGVSLKYDLGAIKDPFRKEFALLDKLDAAVGLVKLFPGMPHVFFNQLLSSQGLKALILETFGSGNASTDPQFLAVIRKLIENDVAVINVTQCTGGMVQQGKYATSKALKEMGVISGMDMTTEAALTKTMHLLGQGATTAELEELIPISLNGELTSNSMHAG